MENKTIVSFIKKDCKLYLVHHENAFSTKNRGNAFETNKMLYNVCWFIKEKKYCRCVDLISFRYIKRYIYNTYEVGNYTWRLY